MSLLDDLPIAPRVEYEEEHTDGIFSTVKGIARNARVAIDNKLRPEKTQAARDDFYQNYAKEFAAHIQQVQSDLHNPKLIKSLKAAVYVTHDQNHAISDEKLADLSTSIANMNVALQTFLSENKLTSAQ
jgi:hypothetical protein